MHKHKRTLSRAAKGAVGGAILTAPLAITTGAWWYPVLAALVSALSSAILGLLKPHE